jgi:hypothetical protein
MGLKDSGKNHPISNGSRDRFSFDIACSFSDECDCLRPVPNAERQPARSNALPSTSYMTQALHSGALAVEQLGLYAVRECGG